MKKKSTLLLFEKIRVYVSNLWFIYVKNPFYYRLIVEPRLKREREKERAKIIKDFEENQKTSIDRVKNIMYHEKVYHENNPKLDYLNQKLVEGRAHVNEMVPFMSRIPFFYEPEICDIHNETLDTKKDDIHKVILNDNKLLQELLRKQKIKADVISTKNKPKYERDLKKH